MEWLYDFLRQSQSGELKTAQYPKTFGPFNMKVSFGQGVAARVPWISFFPDGMTTSQGYYPVYLYYKDSEKLVLSFGVSETNEFGGAWREDILQDAPHVIEVIDNPARYGFSWVFKVYEVENGRLSISEETLQADLDEILGLFNENLGIKEEQSSHTASAGLFYMEKQLEEFIIDNWAASELGKTLELIYEEDRMVSQQYRTSIGPIDILAREKGSGIYVVIELKRNQTSDDTVGQVLRYMGWVKENKDCPAVKGLIIAGKYDEKLHYAQSMIPEIDVYLYQVEFSLREHRR